MTNIFEKTEKLGKLKEEDIEELEPTEHIVLLIITFDNNEQELFYMRPETAAATVEDIYDILRDPAIEQQYIVVHNCEEDLDLSLILSHDKKEFCGILKVDTTIKTVRILDSADIPKRED